MSVNYDNFSSTFSNSRKTMKWEEIDYFIDFILKNNTDNLSILDIGCGNGRLLSHLERSGTPPSSLEFAFPPQLRGIKGESANSQLLTINYLGIDSSTGLIEEAKKLHPNHKFEVLDMKEIHKIPFLSFGTCFKINKNAENSIYDSGLNPEGQLFDSIFFIASFHHLQTITERLEVLKQAKQLLKPNGTIFMTNWALSSDLNSEKYKDSIIENTKNDFKSQDYSIKIGKFTRFYHCFSLEELEYLFKETGFKIIENRLFDNDKNYVSIVSL